jgi:hypothetical protein
MSPSELPGLSEKVGKWVFVYDTAMRAHWEGLLREQELSDEELQQELVEIETEANQASMEISPSGKLYSMVGDEVVYSAELREEAGALCFDKPDGSCVTLSLVGPRELTADEPGKPLMRFRRLGA